MDVGDPVKVTRLHGARAEKYLQPWELPSGPVAKTALPMQEAWVPSLVRERAATKTGDPTCCN